MKKQDRYQFLYAVAILFVMGFIIRVGVDYFKYDTVTNSAPFYTFVLLRALEFLLPALILLVIAIIIKKRMTKEKV